MQIIKNAGQKMEHRKIIQSYTVTVSQLLNNLKSMICHWKQNKSTPLFQDQLKHQKSEMHDLRACEFQLPLQSEAKYLKNMVNELHIFERMRLLLELLQLPRSKIQY